MTAGEAPAAPFCTACEQESDEFAPGPSGRPNARCPHCHALERHRFLGLLLRWFAPVVGSASAVLDVAPQPQVQRILRELVGDAYVGVDLLVGELITTFGDLTRLPFRDDAFDVIVCYHVLEHVPDDRAAMRELARVLTAGGIAIVQVPRRNGKPTDEDPSAPEEERITRFGQADHVRYYGSDFESRMFANGLHAHVLEPRDVLSPEDLLRFAIGPREAVWICRRRVARDEPADFRIRGLGRSPEARPARQVQHLPPTADVDRAAADQVAADRAAVRRLLQANPAGRAALRLRRLVKRAFARRR